MTIIQYYLREGISHRTFSMAELTKRIFLYSAGNPVRDFKLNGYFILQSIVKIPYFTLAVESLRFNDFSYGLQILPTLKTWIKDTHLRPHQNLGISLVVRN